MNDLSQLPNEVWLTVLSYFNTVDLFQSFHNLNQRFNDLIYTSTQHTILPCDVTNTWLEQSLPLIANRMKILTFNEYSMENLSTYFHLFSNIRLINLQGNQWNMSITITQEPLLSTLKSSLRFLDDMTYRWIKLSDYTRSLINNQYESVDPRFIMQRILDGYEENEYQLCPSIIRLSVEIRSIRCLYFICRYANHLRHLKINYFDEEFGYLDIISPLPNSLEIRASLVTLHITARFLLTRNRFDKFLQHFQESLKRLTLDISCPETIDGEYLQSILQPLHQLKVFTLFLQCPIKSIEQCSDSFETSWWMDKHCPPIYIQYKADGTSIITTLPSLHSFHFQNGLYNWLINRNYRDPSSSIHFHTNEISFDNQIHQSIDIEYLYLIDRIFLSLNQSLTFRYCQLDQVKLLYELLMDGESMEPLLTKVKRFTVTDEKELDSLTLIVWILLMPNLEILDISCLINEEKIELKYQLNKLIENDENLQGHFHHIEQLILFSKSKKFSQRIHEELSFDFQKIFPNACISSNTQ